MLEGQDDPNAKMVLLMAQVLGTLENLTDAIAKLEKQNEEIVKTTSRLAGALSGLGDTAELTKKLDKLGVS
jgi:hypothetical protein